MNTSILYSSIRSPHCLKVSMFLHEKGIPFERVEIDLPAKEQKTAAFRRINPLGLVPVYVDDCGPHPDSLLIMHNLEQRYPQPRLFPADDAAYLQALAWIERSSGPYRDVSHHLYWQLIEPPAAGSDMAQVARLKQQGTALLRELEAALGDAPWVLGEAFSVVDVALIPWVHGYRRFDLPPAGEFPAVTAWVDRVTARESFQASYNQRGRPFLGTPAG